MLIALAGCDGVAGSASTGTGGSSSAGTAGTAASGSTAETTSSTGTGAPIPCDTSADCPILLGSSPNCVHDDHLCGAGVKGHCTSCYCGAEGCGNFTVYCGCSGALVDPTFANHCENHDWAIDVASCGAATFACGATACQESTEYCVESGPNPGCYPTPLECKYGVAECNCVMKYGSTAACAEDAPGRVRAACVPPGSTCGSSGDCCQGTQCRKGVCEPCGHAGDDCSVGGADACCEDRYSGQTTCAERGPAQCTACVGDHGIPTLNGSTYPCCCSTPFDPFTGECRARPNAPGDPCDHDCLCASGHCGPNGLCL